MPGGDRTGPAGMGPMTGRGAGYCAGYTAPGYANPVAYGGRGGGFGRGRGGMGMGFGRGGGMGLGRGWGRAYGAGFQAAPQPVAPVNELDALKAQADYFGEMLKDIQGRISELESNES